MELKEMVLEEDRKRKEVIDQFLITKLDFLLLALIFSGRKDLYPVPCHKSYTELSSCHEHSLI